MARQAARRFNNLPDWVREVVQHELASSLLTEPYKWRERRVQTITPIDQRRYRERVSFQLNIPADSFEAALAIVSRRLRKARLPPVARAKTWLHGAKLRQLVNTDWEGETLSLLLPVVTLPKQVLMSLDLEDAAGRRLTLQNRGANAIFSTRHLLTGLYVAELEPGATYRTADIELLIRALMFCMPGGLVHESNFDYDELRGNPRMDTSAMLRFANAYRLYVGDRQRGCVAELVNRSCALYPRLAGNTWKDPEGLRDPVVNPLLLLPDRRKLWREGEAPKNSERWSDAFLDECTRYLDMVAELTHGREARRAAGRNDPAPEYAGDVLMELSRFTHTWIALARLPVSFGESSLVKLTTTGTLDRESWPRLGGGVTQDYATPVGDAASTHIEIVSPEPGVVRIDSSKTVATVGGRRAPKSEIRSIFGFEEAASQALEVFYTTKTRGELAEAAERLESVSAPPPLAEPSENDVRLRVVYRLELIVALVYLLVTTAAVGAAGIALAKVFDRGVEELSTTQAALTAMVALLAATLATREGALVARIVFFQRILLLASLTLLVAALLAAYALAEPEPPEPPDLLVPVTPAVSPSDPAPGAETAPPSNSPNRPGGRGSGGPSRGG